MSKKQNLAKSQSFLPPTNYTIMVFPASCPRKPCGQRCAAAEQLMALLVSEAMRDASFPTWPAPSFSPHLSGPRFATPK